MRSTFAAALLASLALAGLPACQEYAEPSLTPAQLKKVDSHLLKAAPTPQHPVGAVFGDQLELIGYDLDKATAKPGDTVTVTWYLKALKTPMDDTMPFVHFQARPNDRSAWQNLDHHPIEGLHPIRKLKQGEIVKDVQTFQIKDSFPNGPAYFYWGLWRHQGDKSRLPIVKAGTGTAEKDLRLKLDGLTIEGGKARGKVPRSALAMVPKLEAGQAITLDGKLDDPAWQAARPTAWWTSPDGSGRPGPQTRARFRYDDQFLYVGVEATDSDVWSTFTERDSNTWEQEVIELFIDADGDKKDYLELQVTPANVVFDAKFVSYRSDLAKARAWDMAGFKTAVHVDGTLNQRDDTDKGWSVEMAVPLAEVPGAAVPPKHGDTWRVNLFRFDLPKAGRQASAAFSPPIKPDFHTLEKFGQLRFVDPGTRKAPPLSVPGALQRAPIKLAPGRLKPPVPEGMAPPSAAPASQAAPASAAPASAAAAPSAAPHR